MKTKALFLTVVVSLLLGVAHAQQPCVTNYTLIGPPGSVVSTTTNGLPLLTVFVELGTCETNIAYDEIVTDCNGSTTNHLQYTVKVGELFDPHRSCYLIVDQFGNVTEVCTDVYFLTVTIPGAPPFFSIVSSVGSVSYLTDGIPLLTVPTDLGQCSASVTFDVISADCSDITTNTITRTAQVEAPGRLCQLTVDQFGNIREYCYAVVAVDAEPPSFTCPANIAVNAAPGQCSAVVTFATPGAQDNCDASPTVTCNPPSGSTFGGGNTTVTCTAVDASGNTNSCTFTVTVRDTAPPVITLKPAITVMENNHKYRTFRVTDFVASVSDACGGVAAANCVISKVTSDEPDDVPGPGDGNTRDDIKIASGCKSVQLMQERDGTKNGRVYKVTLKVKDAAGNVGEAVARVNVPLSSSGVPAVESSIAQTVNGCVP